MESDAVLIMRPYFCFTMCGQAARMVFPRHDMHAHVQIHFFAINIGKTCGLLLPALVMTISMRLIFNRGSRQYRIGSSAAHYSPFTTALPLPSALIFGRFFCHLGVGWPSQPEVPPPKSLTDICSRFQPDTWHMRNQTTMAPVTIATFRC